MTKNLIVQDVRPSNLSVSDAKTNNINVINSRPNNQNMAVDFGTEIVFIEDRIILKGQPIPWGLNWLITYPIQLNFQGGRV